MEKNIGLKAETTFVQKNPLIYIQNLYSEIAYGNNFDCWCFRLLNKILNVFLCYSTFKNCCSFLQLIAILRQKKTILKLYFNFGQQILRIRSCFENRIRIRPYFENQVRIRPNFVNRIRIGRNTRILPDPDPQPQLLLI